jgi:hypothetical protein
MRFLTFRVFVAALSISAPGAAPALAAPPDNDRADTAVPPPVVVAKEGSTIPAKSPPNFDAIMGVFDKLFPPQPDPDPARFALARTSVQAMWPDGAYGKMMSTLMGGMFDRVMQMKKADLSGLDPKAPKTSATSANTDVSIHDQAAAKDPYFDQRMAAIRQVATEELGKLSGIIDPRMRDGLARSMTRRFDAQQLADINRFFATPSGHALASQYMQLWVDPDTMRSLFGTMPEMMKLMPEMMQKVKAANDKFPKPPTPVPAPKKS